MRRSRFLAPLDDLVTQHYFGTLIACFAAITFAFFATKDYIPFAARLIAPLVLFLALAVPAARDRAVLIFWASLACLANVMSNWYVTANHGFMITFIGFALCIALAAEDRRVMARAAVLLISVLMGLALIQKLVSPYYMSGNLIGSYLASGQMFKVGLSFVVPDWFASVDYNVAQHRALAIDPTLEGVDLVIPPLVAFLALPLTYAALLSQAGLEVMVLMRARLGLWTHYAVMAFVLIIYATRNENVFLSMNLILGYAMTDDTTASARLWYVLGIFYLLAMELMGLRLGIFG